MYTLDRVVITNLFNCFSDNLLIVENCLCSDFTEHLAVTKRNTTIIIPVLVAVSQATFENLSTFKHASRMASETGNIIILNIYLDHRSCPDDLRPHSRR